jgi:hypothetical protein
MSGQYMLPHEPGLFTITIARMVSPRNASSASNRPLETVGEPSDWSITATGADIAYQYNVLAEVGYNPRMKLFRSDITPPEFDVGMMLLAGLFLLPIGLGLLSQHESRQLGAAWLVVSVVNLANAWRAWRCLPDRPPPRFRIRDLLILMTLLAVGLGMTKVLE